MSVGKQLIYILLVNLTTLALAIGTIVPTEADTLVKLNAEPCQCLNDVIFCAGDETTRIGILNAKDQVSTMLFCEQIVV